MFRMRATGLLVILLMPACSNDGAANNSVDVSAAATRAESDIANNAAERRGAHRPTPSATAAALVGSPDPVPASGGPVRANQGTKPQ